MGMAMPFSLLREVNVICSSRDGDHGVFEEQFVEIAEAKEKERVGMLFLDRGILPHQGRGRLAHVRNCADYNSQIAAALSLRTCASAGVTLRGFSRQSSHGEDHFISNAAAVARKFLPETAQNVCPKDGGPLYVRYDLAEIRRNTTRESVNAGPKSMWRYAAVLPDAEPVTLGEGLTPMLPSRKYPNLLIKDEGLNPTGSFKARGMSAAHHHGAPLRAHRSWLRPRPETPEARWPPMLPQPGSRHTSSCRRMCRSPTGWRWKPAART